MQRLIPQHVRVFISSPSDVEAEAGLVAQTLRQIQESAAWRGKFTFGILRWNDPDAPTPMDGGLTPQQAVDRSGKPSESDIVVIILWGRFGTPLSTPRRADGSAYLSGTEYEFEEARTNPRTRILLYRRLDDPVVSLRATDVATRQSQLALLDKFFARFTAEDGSLSVGYKSYRGVEAFTQLFRGDLESTLRQLERDAPAAPHDSIEIEPSQPEDDDLDAADWPDSPSRTSLFLSAVELAADSEIAVVSCVAVDDVATLNGSLTDTLQSWLRDPYLRDLPGIPNLVRRRDLIYTALDPEVQAKLIDWLSSQLFEAYVSYSRASPIDAMLDSLLRDRLLANRTKVILVKPDRTLAAHRADVIRLTTAAKDHVRTTSKNAVALAVSVEDASRTDAGATVAMLVGQVVRDRLRTPSGREGRAFSRIHPQKIRVMHDFDRRVRYTRRDPFQG